MFRITAYYGSKRVQFNVAANSVGQAIVKAYSVATHAESITATKV